MREVFRDHPSAVAQLARDRRALRARARHRHRPLPHARVPGARPARRARRCSREQAWSGLRARLGLAPDEPIPPQHGEYAKRMEHELGVINTMGFAGYFLIVADFIGYARRSGIPVGPGRGSAAGSLVAWQPRHHRRRSDRVRHHLRALPESRADQHARHRRRLLHEGPRSGDPLRRREVRRRGRRRPARRADHHLREAAGARRGARRRAACSACPTATSTGSRSSIPDTLGITLDEALEQSPELRARIDADGQVAQLFETARRLEGLTRHASTHAAGVVIGTEPLIETVPLYRDPRSGDVVTQFDMRCVEKIGLIKFDFLGLQAR